METEEFLLNLRKDIDSLFSKVFNLNFQLLQKSESGEDFTIKEVFDFYITSHAESFLKSYYTGHYESRGILLNSRCIIEGLALRAMCDSNDLSQINFELLKYEKALIEKQKYEPFFNIAPESFAPEEMNEKYELARSKYFEILNDKFDDKDIIKILKSKIPFICDPKLSYRAIIEKYLGEDVASIYSILSIFIHPNSNEEIDTQVLFSILITTVELIRATYDKFPLGQYSCKSYMLMVTSPKDAEHYMDAIKRECRVFEEIEKIFNECSGPNYVSNTFHAISMLIQEMTLDKIFGFSEQTKSKFKCMLELIVSFYDTYVNVHSGELVDIKYRLLQCHREIMIKLATGQELDTIEAYEFYKKGYKNGVNKDKFDQVFMKTTGYSINEKGQTRNLTDSIMNLFNFFKKDANSVYAKFADSALLDYAESQMLSHANGYMWFANSGAWGDVNNIFLETNAILCFIFRVLNLYFKDAYKNSRDRIASKIALTFDQSIALLKAASKSLRRIQAKPMGQL